jgi:tRNA(fMet)-specific endonuclease VapC
MTCLDTSFIIDLLRGRKEAKHAMEKLEIQNEKITIASPTIMELVSGSQKNEKLKNDKEKIMGLLSSLRVLPLAEDEAILAGEIESMLEKKGEMINTEDIMIGAIVKHHNEIILTRNKKHFEKIPDLKIESY